MAREIQELEVFVKEAYLKGCHKNSIERVMLDAGWSAEQARSALQAYAEIEFPIPVPKPRPQLSAKEAFMYLVMFSTLYTSAYHLGSLLFDFIIKAFPDPTDHRIYQHRDSMRWAVSALLIAFPVFLFTSIRITKDLILNPVKRLSPIRRWLTYLTLFIASIILIGDMTTLVYNLLGGELTIRFCLKVTVVGLIAGTIFVFYLRDLRKEEHSL